MGKTNKWHVRAFDTDYGFDNTWDFATRELAEMWQKALLFDYGEECGAYIYETEEENNDAK